MFVLTVFSSLIGLAICSFILGFFNAASSPTVNECILVVAGSDYFNYGFGQSIVFIGVGVVLGAPIAGRYVVSLSINSLITYVLIDRFN